MKPKYKIGQITKVYEYYTDGIIKGVFYGLIVDIDKHCFPISGATRPSQNYYIYHILPNEANENQKKGVQTAEESAIEEVDQ